MKGRVGWIVLALALLMFLVSVRLLDPDLDDEIGTVDASRSMEPEVNGEPLSDDKPAGPGDDDDGPAVLETRSESGVPIRIVRRPRLDPPAPPYATVYPLLHAAAENGEPTAQYRLGQLLYRCRSVPVEEDELAAQIDRVYQTRRHGGWDVDDPAQTEHSLRQDFEHCAGVPAEQRGRYRDWMRRAADQDLMEAQLNLMFHLPQAEYCQFIENCTPEQARLMAELREQARQDVTRALEAGSVEALRTMGGWALNEEMGTPDPVQALAYFSAYDQIQRAAGRESELEAMLAGLRARLRPVDLDEADNRASDLLRNPRCCQVTR
ncbi:hypothetical protein [Panacagrimonas sp.]|uniref:hypothetical protein n=1 Tax=Panacagrimonas sp. TaxID=2480088 RepID=UPI003B51DA36